MKRVKAINGYTIYQMTARDEKNGNGTEGEYSIYFSSDVRDYGVTYSTPEYEGIETLEQAIECISDPESVAFAQAKEELEEEYTTVSYDDIVERMQETTTDREENPTMEEVRTFTVGTFNALVIPEQNWSIFDDDHKTDLNRVEKLGLEAVLADFVSEYEKDVLGDACDSIKSYIRWNDDGVDILDGIIDTYVFYNYAIGSVWMTSNGCILIDAVDLEVYDGLIDDTIDDDYISDFEQCDVCEKPYKYDIWSECKRVLIRID